jgi:hypothetical protein
MIGTNPVAASAPLEYRIALDVAAVRLNRQPPVYLKCAVPQLQAEAAQRLTLAGEVEKTQQVLWVEPLADSWQSDLTLLNQTLKADATLVIVISLPLARLLPERRTWTAKPLGLRPSGFFRLQQALKKAGYQLEGRFGFHSLWSIGLNFAVKPLERLNYRAWSDRWHFAARLAYQTKGHLTPFSTVGLLVARKTNP